jgi:hypothetical protein
MNARSPIFWKGICKDERTHAIQEIEKIANRFGFITDFHMFSDVEISIKIEVEELHIDELYKALGDYLSLNEYKGNQSESRNERVIFLNTTFLKSTGNLKIEVPSVPG